MMEILQEAMAIHKLVLRNPTYNLAPETGVWIIGDDSSDCGIAYVKASAGMMVVEAPF